MHRRGVLAANRRRSAGGVPPAFVAATRGGDGQTTTVTNIPTTIPAGAAIGNVAVMFLCADGNQSLSTPPSGWTLRSGPDAASANTHAWVYTRTLQSGDPGASVTVTLPSAQECGSIVLAFEGVTETGLQINSLLQGTATNTLTLPTLTGVPAGAMLVAGWARRRSGAGGTITVPSPYATPATGAWINNYGATINTFGASGYDVTAAGGSVGGEAGTTTGITNVGTNYLLALPAA